jgi:uncharacterized repeat protein (TIGR02543 family)
MRMKKLGQHPLITNMILLVAFFLVVNNVNAGTYSGGDGSEETPYQIADTSDLIELSKYENRPDWSEFFIQTADIAFDVNEQNVDWDGDGSADWDEEGDQLGFSPIGFNPDRDLIVPFTGTYDGNGHTITNLYIDRPTTEYIGLFGQTSDSSGSGAIIKNLGIVDVSITGDFIVGGLVGANGHYSTISNCYSTGNVNARHTVGGLVGLNFGDSRYIESHPFIENSYSTVNVEASTTLYSETAGGLVGNNEYSNIQKSYSKGSVTGTEDNVAGGLVGGSNNGVTENSFWDTNLGPVWSLGGTGKTSAEMRNYNTYTDVTTEGLDTAWDFTNHWTINSEDNGGYPALAWQGYEHRYPVTYDANGADDGSVPDAQEKAIDTPLTLAENTGDLFRTGYGFIGWNTQADGSGDDYAAGAEYTDNAALKLYAKWQDSMTIVFNTQADGASGLDVTLPLQGTVDVTVEWGDGTRETYTTPGDKTHTYAEDGEYTVYISGTLTQFGNGASSYSHADKLTSVTTFGVIEPTSLSGAFNGASNLSSVPTTLPSTVTDTSSMFKGANSFNQDISDWDVSSVTDMSSMFHQASAFNQDIGGWDIAGLSTRQKPHNLFKFFCFLA